MTRRKRKQRGRCYDEIGWLPAISTRTRLPPMEPAPKLETQKGWATGKKGGKAAYPRGDAALQRAVDSGFVGGQN